MTHLLGVVSTESNRLMTCEVWLAFTHYPRLGLQAKIIFEIRLWKHSSITDRQTRTHTFEELILTCYIGIADWRRMEWIGSSWLRKKRGSCSASKPAADSGVGLQGCLVDGLQVLCILHKRPVKRIWGMRAAAYLKWSSNAVSLRVTGAWQQRRVEL